MLINNNVLQFCGTFLSENLNVYLMLIISLERCESVIVSFLLFKKMQIVHVKKKKKPLLFSNAFAWYTVQIKRESHSAVVLKKPEWALTFLPSFGEGANEVISKATKKSISRTSWR